MLPPPIRYGPMANSYGRMCVRLLLWHFYPLSKLCRLQSSTAKKFAPEVQTRCISVIRHTSVVYKIRPNGDVKQITNSEKSKILPHTGLNPINLTAMMMYLLTDYVKDTFCLLFWFSLMILNISIYLIYHKILLSFIFIITPAFLVPTTHNTNYL